MISPAPLSPVEEYPHWRASTDCEGTRFSLELFDRGMQAILDAVPGDPYAIVHRNGSFAGGDYGAWVAELHRLGREVDPANPYHWIARPLGGDHGCIQAPLTLQPVHETLETHPLYAAKSLLDNDLQQRAQPIRLQGLRDG